MLLLQPFRRVFRVAAAFAGSVLVAGCAFAQAPESSSDSSIAPAPGVIEGKPSDAKTDEPDRRILGVLPNYRTVNPMAVYAPITTRQKFSIALRDSFDWPNYIVSAGFAGLYQLEDSHPSFGQGLKGYAHRYWTSYVDQSMGNLMAEAVMPAMLHEDPRYFRKAEGTVKSRLFYSLTRVLVTRTDAGGRRFNFSEIVGNGVMASVGNAYYPDERGFADTMNRLSLQVGTDALSNVLKEFWPDIKRHLHHDSAQPH